MFFFCYQFVIQAFDLKLNHKIKFKLLLHRAMFRFASPHTHLKKKSAIDVRIKFLWFQFVVINLTVIKMKDIGKQMNNYVEEWERTTFCINYVFIRNESFNFLLCHLFRSCFFFFLSIQQVSFFLSSYVVPLFLISLLYITMLVRLWKGAPGCKPSAESR